MARRSLLLLIPQSPLDSASGAAVSEKTTCEMLARAGWGVSAVGTLASESFNGPGTRRLAQLDIQPERFTLASGTSWLRFSLRDVQYWLLDTGILDVNEARSRYTADLDALLDLRLSEGVPNVLVTYGSNEAEIQRRMRVRERGARVIFSMHNFEYRSPAAFTAVDRILTPSRFVTGHYQRTHGVDSTPLPVPVTLEDVIAPRREATFFTLINPTEVKGARLFIRLVRECSERWPEIPFLAVESRGSGNRLATMIEESGASPVHYQNLYVAANTPNPASIYAVTKVLLMPSLVEPSGRVAVEAQLNAIPVMASDRDGLPETVGSSGLVLPAVPDPDSPDGHAAVGRWLELIGRLHSDAVLYETASRAASEGVVPHRRGDVEQERVAFFERIAMDSCVAGVSS